MGLGRTWVGLGNLLSARGHKGTICPPVEMLAPDGKRRKGLTKENLRDNMTNVELALNTLAAEGGKDEVAALSVLPPRQASIGYENR